MPPPVLRRCVAVEAGVITLAALLAAAGHFAVRQGRAVTCADSMQYLDNALALIAPGVDADFSFRKPGYSLLMAGCLAWGGGGWLIVLANHALVALLAPLAYGLALRLSGLRPTGWLAGAIVIARSMSFPWSDRIMAEPLYAFLITAALFSLTLTRSPMSGAAFPGNQAVGAPAIKPEARESRAALLWAGCLLAAAWLVRSSATAVIFSAVLWGVWRLRRAGCRRCFAAAACLMMPVSLAWGAECALNAAGTGEFRPCTGTLGPMLVMRACSLQGAPLAPGPARRPCLDLLPERSPEDAYRVNKLDAWIARARAIREAHLSEWQADDLFMQAGWDTLRADLLTYARTTGELLALQLCRADESCLSDAFPRAPLAPTIDMPLLERPLTTPPTWFAGCALPHRSDERSAQVARTLASFETVKAPFADAEPWRTLRYAVMQSWMIRAAAWVGAPGSWPPILTLLMCLLMRRRRSGLSLIAVVYVADALLAAATLASLEVASRMQDVWLGSDAALAACAIGLVAVGLGRRRLTFASPQPHRPDLAEDRASCAPAAPLTV